MEQERDEFKQKLEEALAKAPEKPAEATKPVTGEDRKVRVKAATKAALSTIRELDRTDEDYDDKVEDAWTSALLEAGMAESPLTQAEIDKMVANSMKAQKEADAVQAQEATNAKIWEQAIDFAKKSGLNMAPGSADDRLFRDIANNDLSNQDFMKGETQPPLEDQFKWVVGEVRKITGQVVETSEAEKERARKEQIKNGVLTRGNNPSKSKEPETQDFSISSLRKTEKQQRIDRQRGV